MTAPMHWIGDVVTAFHQVSTEGCAQTGLIRSQIQGRGAADDPRIGSMAKSTAV